MQINTDYWLLTTDYSLLTAYYSLLTTYYLLLTTYSFSLLLTTDYLLLTTYYSLRTTDYLLLTTYYVLLTTDVERPARGPATLEFTAPHSIWKVRARGSYRCWCVRVLHIRLRLRILADQLRAPSPGILLTPGGISYY